MAADSQSLLHKINKLLSEGNFEEASELVSDKEALETMNFEDLKTVTLSSSDNGDNKSLLLFAPAVGLLKMVEWLYELGRYNNHRILLDALTIATLRQQREVMAFFFRVQAEKAMSTTFDKACSAVLSQDKMPAHYRQQGCETLKEMYSEQKALLRNSVEKDRQIQDLTKERDSLLVKNQRLEQLVKELNKPKEREKTCSTNASAAPRLRRGSI